MNTTITAPAVALTDTQRDILAALDAGKEVIASKAYPSSTLKAMERRGWLTLERKSEAPLHGSASWYTLATITLAGLSILRERQAEDLAAVEPDEKLVTVDPKIAERQDEAAFNGRVAAGVVRVEGNLVVRVGRFCRGGLGRYAAAYVISERDHEIFKGRRFSTNELVWDDDRERWVMFSGHYDLTWDEAIEDLAER